MTVRDRVSRERLTVVLTGTVGILSVLTGVTAANVGSTYQLGVLAAYVSSPIQRLVALTGAYTGFLLLASAWGLHRQFRVGWLLAVVLLPFAAVQGLAQSSVISLPLVVLALVTLALVASSRTTFRRPLAIPESQLTALTVLGGILVYGTVGTYALRADFQGISTPLDALYYTIVTASTVGYGDIAPTATPFARAFSLSLIVVGTGGFAVTLGVLLTPAIEARVTNALGKMTSAELDMLEDHVIVLGYGDLTEPILNELDDRINFVVVTDDSDLASALGDRGYRTYVGDPSDDATMERVRLDRAVAVVAATNDDAEDALAVLTARQLNSDVRIVVAATDRNNVEKLRRAGANTVISPATIGGHLLAQSALGHQDVETVAERVMKGEESPL